MFEAIYKVRIKKDSLNNYMKAWQVVAQHMMLQQGAVVSRFYVAEDSQDCIIHSRWPTRQMNQKAWPLQESDPDDIRAAADAMQGQRESASTMNLSLSALQNYCDSQGFRLVETVESVRNHILVYNDEGCGSSAYELVEMMKQVVDQSVCRILLVDSDYVKLIPTWEAKARLFVMPGGRARPYYPKLGAEWVEEVVSPGQMRKLKTIGLGNERIRDFVEQGGSYLGICAGAYYGAAQTVFERDGALEVLDEGPLNFFPGVAEGPAFGLGRFQYASEQGAEVAQISGSSLVHDRITSYFNGGCFFTMPDEQQVVPPEQAVARYVNIKQGVVKDQPVPAMVKNMVGRGQAVLSGFHFEHASTSTNTAITDAVRAELAAGDEDRLLFCAEILSGLGIPLNEQFHEALYAEPEEKLELLGEASQQLYDFNRVHFPVIGSTQDYSKEHYKDLQLGKWQSVIAEQQTKGRGTLGREWRSPLGNAYVTFATLLPLNAALGTEINRAIPQVVAFSIVQVLKTFGLAPEYKWVNDVLLNKQKVAGILCETIPAANRGLHDSLHVGVGININLSRQACEEISQPATSMNLVLGKLVNKDLVISLLEQSLAHHLALLFKKGYGFFREAIDAQLAFKGQRIVFDTETRDFGVLEGMLLGINDKGELLLKSDERGEAAHFTGRILKGKELEKHYLNVAKAQLGKQLDSPSGPGLLQSSVALHGGQPAFTRIKFDQVGSTQDFVTRNANKGLFERTNMIAVTAEEQTKGRGTHSRRWASPPNVNIYVTFGIILPSDANKIAQMKNQPVTTQLVALAVVKTLSEFGFSPKIKWRNDVRVDGKKICGVLCEPAPEQEPILTEDGRPVGLIGIGLNVNMDRAICESLDQPVTSMAVEKGSNFDKEQVFQRLSVHLAGIMKIYFDRGFQALKGDIESFLEGVGQTIQVEDEASGQLYTGEFLGVDEAGCLRLQLDGGDLHTINRGRIDKQSLEVPSSKVMQSTV